MATYWVTKITGNEILTNKLIFMQTGGTQTVDLEKKTRNLVTNKQKRNYDHLVVVIFNE